MPCRYEGTCYAAALGRGQGQACCIQLRVRVKIRDRVSDRPRDRDSMQHEDSILCLITKLDPNPNCRDLSPYPQRQHFDPDPTNPNADPDLTLSWCAVSGHVIECEIGMRNVPGCHVRLGQI